MATFTEAKAIRDHLHAEVDRTSTVMQQYPANGPRGLVQDEIKFSATYRADKAAFDRAFAKLRAFNAQFTKAFRKEIADERQERRAARTVPFVDVAYVTEYGLTQKLSQCVRVF